MIFIKILITIFTIAIMLAILFYGVNIIKPTWAAKGDFNLTVRTIFKTVKNSPKKLFSFENLIQEKSNFSISMERIDNGYITISDNTRTINETFLEGKQQYRIIILNKNTNLIDVKVKFKFPVALVEKKITKHEGAQGVTFEAEIPLFKAVTNGGSITMPGKKFSSFYNLSINKLEADGSVELVITLDSTKSLSEEIRYIAGTYSRMINGEKVEEEIYYSINKQGSKYSLGEKSNIMPQLKEGFEIHF